MRKAVILVLSVLIIVGCNNRELPFGLKTNMGIMEIIDTVGAIQLLDGSDDEYSFTPVMSLMEHINSYSIRVRKGEGFKELHLKGYISGKNSFERMEDIKGIVNNISAKFGKSNHRRRGSTLLWEWNAEAHSEDDSISVFVTTYPTFSYDEHELYDVDVVYISYYF